MRGFAKRICRLIAISAALSIVVGGMARRSNSQELFVTGFGDANVRRFDANTGASFGIFAALGGSFTQIGPDNTIFGPDGNLYISAENQNRVIRVNGTTGALLADFVPPNANGLTLPLGLRFHNGSLFVGSFFSTTFGPGNIQRYDATTGAFQGVFVNSLTDNPLDFDFGPDGNLYLALRNLNRIDKFNGTTGASMGTVVANVFPQGGGFLQGAWHIAFGPDGNMYVSRFAGSAGLSTVMLRFTPGGVPLGTVINDSFYETHPAGGFVFTADGLIDILDEGTGATNGSVRQYNATTGAFVKTLVANIPGVPVSITLRPTVTDATSRVQITRSAFRFNAGTNTYVQRVIIKNISATPITGPISLVLDSLSVNATLAATNGSTASHAPFGSPYVNFVLSGTSLAPGATATVALNFIDPSNALITYSPRILAGAGVR